MLNSIQVKLLRKGFHSNTSWRKLFKLPTKVVAVPAEKDASGIEIIPEFTFTPNRQQRRRMKRYERLNRWRSLAVRNPAMALPEIAGPRKSTIGRFLSSIKASLKLK